MTHETFKAACDLEDPIAKINDFSFALLLMSSEIPDDTGLAVHRLATEIRGQAKLLDELHGKLFHALHPGPAALLETEGAA